MKACVFDLAKGFRLHTHHGRAVCPDTLSIAERTRLLRHLWLAVAALCSVCACNAAPDLIYYERLLYINGPPTSGYAQGLTQARDGRLYGILRSRVNNGGVIFAVDANGANYSILRASSTNRAGGVMEGHDGHLYGTEAGDPRTNIATLFRINRDGSAYTILRTFSSGQPQCGLVQDTNGWLYGTTVGDGVQGYGTVFRTATNGSGYQVLHQFGGPENGDGAGPGALMFGRDGSLYGCTFHGGHPTNAGTIFKIGRDGSAYSVLHRFIGAAGGNYPAAGQVLLEDSGGYLYGAADGGIDRAGIIFKITTYGDDYQIIHEFAGHDQTGDSPIGGLVEGPDGALYGTTYEGGIDGAGTIFRLSKDGTGFAILRIYIDAPNPGDTEGTPTIGLLPGADGRLYGLTSGGSVAEGTLFRFSIVSTLSMQRTNETIILSWRQGPDSYELLQADALGAASNWTQVNVPATAIDSEWRVMVDSSVNTKFFRLRKL